jgi:hypothetical protein
MRLIDERERGIYQEREQSFYNTCIGSKLGLWPIVDTCWYRTRRWGGSCIWGSQKHYCATVRTEKLYHTHNANFRC